MDQFLQIDIARIFESPLNPRKRFNEKALAELTASVAAQGVLQPILVRPDNTGKYEIVAGARRYRAAVAAGLGQMPAVVRALTDEQLLEAAVIENLQRDDLHPLEEAEGYEAMMKHGYSADQLAEKIGKSRSYIFGRLKLLALSEEGKRLFFGGLLTPSTALLVARIPSEKLQARCIEEITQQDYHGDVKSYREAQRWIQNRYMLRLAEAPFPIDQTDLIATAGGCGPCPKRTGNSPDLFDDLNSADLCTDPDCFNAKKAAQAARRIKEAGEDAKVISGDEAKKIWPEYYAEPKQTHVKLDAKCYEDPQHRTYREILGDDKKAVAFIERADKGDLVEVVPRKAVAEKLKAQGIVTHAEKAKDDEKKLKAKVLLAQAWRERMFATLRQECSSEAMEDGITGLLIDLLPVIAQRYLAELGHGRGDTLATLWGAIGNSGYARYEAFVNGITNLSTEQLFLLLIDCALIGQTQCDQHSYEREPEALMQACRKMEIDPEALFKAVKEEQKAAEQAKKPPKKSKKTQSAPSGEALPPSEAAQAADLSRAEGEWGATEAAQAGELPADEENSAAFAANEKPSAPVQAFSIGDRVQVRDIPDPRYGLKSTHSGKQGIVSSFWYADREYGVTIEGSESFFIEEMLEPAAEESIIENDEKPTGPNFVFTSGDAEPIPDSGKRYSAVAVQYRHPEEATLTWSGRGRKPKWVENYLAEGHTLADIEITGAAA